MAYRGASSLAARFSSPSACKRLLGVTGVELRVLVAVAACQRAEQGFPTRDAIRQITGGGRDNMPSNLVAVGLLRTVDRTSERQAVYGLSEAGWRVVGEALGEGSVAAE